MDRAVKGLTASPTAGGRAGLQTPLASLQSQSPDLLHMPLVTLAKVKLTVSMHLTMSFSQMVFGMAFSPVACFHCDYLEVVWARKALLSSLGFKPLY